MTAYRKGEGVVTAPWRAEADHAAAARLGCRPHPFQPKGGTRAERRAIIRRVLLAVIPGWLPHFERLEPETASGPVMTTADLAPKPKEIVAEPIKATELPEMSVILRRALEAKRKAELEVKSWARSAEMPLASTVREAVSWPLPPDRYGGIPMAA